MKISLLTLYLCSLFFGWDRPAYAQIPPPKQENGRILVIGGGGSRGAWGGGFAQHLSDSLGPYSVAFGTSTGSLIAPFVVLDDFVTLKTAYTSLTQQSIFSKNPFKQNGELNGFKAVIRLILGRETFGESRNLRKLIDRYLTPDRYNRIRDTANHLNFTVTVVDLQSAKAYYQSSRDIADLSKMKDWIWASSNEPLFMSYYDDPATARKEAYVDGGVLENVPLVAALDYTLKNGNGDIDVIVNAPYNNIVDTVFATRNILTGLTRLTNLWEHEIRNNNIALGKLEALVNREGRHLFDTEKSSGNDIAIHTYYFPPALYTTENQHELLFDKTRMTAMWNAGYQGLQDPTILQRTLYIRHENIQQAMEEMRRR